MSGASEPSAGAAAGSGSEGTTTSDGHTVIQIAVPEMEPLVRAAGLSLVCPHITVLGPFVRRRDVPTAVLERLGEVVSTVAAFEVSLVSVEQFPSGLRYLAPEPAAPLLRLTDALTEAFPQFPPYGGAFDRVVPHLTLGAALPGDRVAAVERSLPVRSQAEEVTLTWWSGGVAEDLMRFPLAR